MACRVGLRQPSLLLRQADVPGPNAPRPHRARGGVLSAATAIALLAGLLWIAAEDAQASHYRFGTLSWEPTENPNEVHVFGKQAWRASFYGYPPVGTLVPVGTIHFGDGFSLPLRVSVMEINFGEDWFLGDLVTLHGAPLIHEYGLPEGASGSWVVGWESCCRIGTMSGEYWHVNNPDRDMRLRVPIDLLAPPNRSPITTLAPIQWCTVGTVCTFPLLFTDPDGDAMTFRLALPNEVSSTAFIQPGPPFAPFPAAVGASTGTVTWDTTMAVHTPGPINYWSMGAVASDGSTSVTVDFLICLHLPPEDSGLHPCEVNETPPPPVVDFEWSHEAPCSGEPVTFTDLSTFSFPSNAATSVWSGPFSATGPTPFDTVHAFPAAGAYTVFLTVTDEHGRTNQTARVVEVQQCPPLAWFEWTPPDPCDGDVVTFIDLSQLGAAGVPTASIWSGPFSAMGVTPFDTQHIFPTDGTYAVTLTVTDGFDGSDSITHTIRVETCAAAVTPRPPAPVAGKQPMPPDQVTGVHLVAADDSFVHIAWDTAWRAHRYEVHCGEESGFALTPHTLVGMTTGLEFVHEGLAPGHSCHYRVVAVGETGTRGPPSEALEAGTLQEALIPDPPRILDFRVTVTPEGVTMAWRTDRPVQASWGTGPPGRTPALQSHAHGDAFESALGVLAPGAHDYRVVARSPEGTEAIRQGRFLVHAGEKAMKSHADRLSEELLRAGAPVHAASFYIVDDGLDGSSDGIEDAIGRLHVSRTFPGTPWFLLQDLSGAWFLADIQAGDAQALATVRGHTVAFATGAGQEVVSVHMEPPGSRMLASVPDERPGQQILAVARDDGSSVQWFWRGFDGVHILDDPHASYTITYDAPPSAPVVPLQAESGSEAQSSSRLAWVIGAGVALLLAGAAVAAVVILRRRR